MSERLHAPPEPVPADICPIQRYGEHLYLRRRDGTRVCTHCLKVTP